MRFHRVTRFFKFYFWRKDDKNHENQSFFLNEVWRKDAKYLLLKNIGFSFIFGARMVNIRPFFIPFQKAKRVKSLKNENMSLAYPIPRACGARNHPILAYPAHLRCAKRL